MSDRRYAHWTWCDICKDWNFCHPCSCGCRKMFCRKDLETHRD